MENRTYLIGFLIVMVYCLVLIIYNQKTNLYMGAHMMGHSHGHSYGNNHGHSYDHNHGHNYGHNHSHSQTIGPNSSMPDIIRHQRYLIEQATKDYNFLPDTQLTDYTPSTGGTPIRNIIIATWRSGSTFLGDVINAVPANFYHYEPLMDFGIKQVRGPPDAKSAVAALKNLLRCDYNNMKRYLNFAKKSTIFFANNKRLWSVCDSYKLCWNSTFLNDFCKEFPFQSMKLVRLRLNLAEELLKDQLLNVKILLLIRDPRGILQSRKPMPWCRKVADCSNPKNLCADMVSNYNAAVQFQKKYPNKFRAIRYEDLSLNPPEMVQTIFHFFELDFHSNVKSFLDSHSKANKGDKFSTFRDSKSAPFHWRSDLKISEIKHIEKNCDEAMKQWGYVKIKGNTNLTDFNPLTSYVI